MLRSRRLLLIVTNFSIFWSALVSHKFHRSSTPFCVWMQVFTDAMMGRTDSDLHTVTSGRWAFTKVDKNTDPDGVSARSYAQTALFFLLSFIRTSRQYNLRKNHIGVLSPTLIQPSEANHRSYCASSPTHIPDLTFPSLPPATGAQRVRPAAVPVEHQQGPVRDALRHLLWARLQRLLPALPHLRGRPACDSEVSEASKRERPCFRTQHL
jgi:hypothetical protein